MTSPVQGSLLANLRPEGAPEAPDTVVAKKRSKKVAAAPEAKPHAGSVGRMSVFGIQHPWQLPLMLPTSWQDFRVVAEGYKGLMSEVPQAIRCQLAGEPVYRKTRKQGIGFAEVPLRLGDGTPAVASIFGPTEELMNHLRANDGGPTYIVGVPAQFGNKVSIGEPKPLAPMWAGKLRPVYKGAPRVVKPETVRMRVLLSLKTEASATAAMLLDQLGETPSNLRTLCRIIGLDPASDRRSAEARIVATLVRAHLPASVEVGQQHQLRLERLAAYGGYLAALANAPAGQTSRFSRTTTPRITGLPFRMSRDQLNAVEEIAADLRGCQTMRRLLSGDVGAGKTAVYASVAAGVVDAGGSVAILLPNENLARQVYGDITQWWPDLLLQTRLVTASTTTRASGACVLPGPSIAVGTTSLLTDAGVQPDLVVVDEQHKFSREQREQLVSSGAHLLEVTATCIPRSQALVQYGVIKVSRIYPHVDKKIESRVITPQGRRALFASILETLKQDAQALVVYPVRGDTAGEDIEESALPTAVEGFAAWNKAFPGQVALAHGGQTAAQNEAAMMAMRTREAKILVSTTVVEVGVNIPGLRHVVVMHPERFGATQLHQLRGRASRGGGWGRFDMYAPIPLGEPTKNRLAIVCRYTDGFELADADMKLRGLGDLSRNSKVQSGADETFLFGRPLSVERLNEVFAIVNEEAGDPELADERSQTGPR